LLLEGKSAAVSNELPPDASALIAEHGVSKNIPVPIISARNNVITPVNKFPFFIPISSLYLILFYF
jgi:hypothetical protein